MSSPQQNRIRFSLQADLLSIRIPVRKNVKAIGLVLLVSIPWALVLLFLVSRSLLHHTIPYAPQLYLLAILIWFGVGAAGYTFLSWMFFGRERVVLSKDQILIEKPLVFYNRRNYYRTADISELKVGREIYKARENGQWIDRERSIITFEYPGKQVIFGRGNTPEEAQLILLKMAQSGLLPTKSVATTHLV
jgi:hypothetical protein